MIWPKHIAIIPDWNRTRAKEKGLPKFVWHTKWFENVIKLTKYIFSETPVKVLTVWGLSTENLKNRTEEELTYLFDIYKKWNKDLEEFLKKNKINFKRVGSEEWLPNDLVKFLRTKEKEIRFEDSDRWSIVAINYWWRDEIIRWVNSLLEDFRRKGPKFFESIDEEILSSYLDFAEVPPVDLVIRTKWKMAQRLSGFMLWWIWYSELYFTDKYFPDFDIEDLKKALKWFNDVYEYRNFWK